MQVDDALPIETVRIITSAAKNARAGHEAYEGPKDSDPACLMAIAAVQAYIAIINSPSG